MVGGFDDTLGKRIGPTQFVRPSTNGWLAADEQHYGHLDLCAYYALTGRLWALDCMRDLTEVWLASRHEFAGRGIGRSWLDMATIYRLTGDKRISNHIREVYRTRLAGWDGRIDGPVKAFPRFKDRRALLDAQGNPVECAVAWQIGLLIPGLEAGYAVTGDVGIREMLRLNVEAFVRCGWFQAPDGRWLEVDYWVFRGGASTVAADYGNDGNVPGGSHRTGWFGSWVARATLLGDTQLSGSLKAKARRIRADSYGTVRGDWTGTQWR